MIALNRDAIISKLIYRFKLWHKFNVSAEKVVAIQKHYQSMTDDQLIEVINGTVCSSEESD